MTLHGELVKIMMVLNCAPSTRALACRAAAVGGREEAERSRRLPSRRRRRQRGGRAEAERRQRGAAACRTTAIGDVVRRRHDYEPIKLVTRASSALPKVAPVSRGDANEEQ